MFQHSGHLQLISWSICIRNWCYLLHDILPSLLRQSWVLFLFFKLRLNTVFWYLKDHRSNEVNTNDGRVIQYLSLEILFLQKYDKNAENKYSLLKYNVWLIWINSSSCWFIFSDFLAFYFASSFFSTVLWICNYALFDKIAQVKANKMQPQQQQN